MREHTWYMSSKDWEHYLNVLSLMEYTEPETDEFEALKDELQSIPGHPQNVNPEDFIRVKITSVQH